MDGWQAVLLTVGGLALFVLLVFGAAAFASGLLNQDALPRSSRSRRSSKRPPKS